MTLFHVELKNIIDIPLFLCKKVSYSFSVSGSFPFPIEKPRLPTGVFLFSGHGVSHLAYHRDSSGNAHAG